MNNFAFNPMATAHSQWSGALHAFASDLLKAKAAGVTALYYQSQVRLACIMQLGHGNCRPLVNKPNNQYCESSDGFIPASMSHTMRSCMRTGGLHVGGGGGGGGG